MERAATVTRKGQITVPLEVRKALDLQTGDRVFFPEGCCARRAGSHRSGRGGAGVCAPEGLRSAAPESRTAGPFGDGT
ncbi:MAG: AbrB/MazE/SpoVT family DNA-binding domain-containing protein [Chloroflexi bacterium]|nr:AbrB/MazE/SpoVT family DNA-binding domain-containing protein [Chloroflexota bacterium]